jgi:ubiquitin-like domain-containing CTD phosphatase 1
MMLLHASCVLSARRTDIIIWSATSMKWIEVKMRELGVLGHADYKITALVDHRCVCAAVELHCGLLHRL